MKKDRQTESTPAEAGVRNRLEKNEILSDLLNSGLNAHITSYVIVNTFLVMVWRLSGRRYPWFLWVMAGWGTGVAFHIFGHTLASRCLASRSTG